MYLDVGKRKTRIAGKAEKKAGWIAMINDWYKMLTKRSLLYQST